MYLLCFVLVYFNFCIVVSSLLFRNWSKSIGGGGWAGAEMGWVISF